MMRQIINYSSYPLLLILLSVLFLTGCVATSDDDDNDSEDPTITVSNVTFEDNTAGAAHLFDLEYNIQSDQDAEDTLVSFYLYSVEEPGADDNENDPKAYKNLLGADLVGQLTANTSMTRQVSFRVPDDLEDGDYYIDTYVNEHQNALSQEVSVQSNLMQSGSSASTISSSSQFIRATGSVTLDNSAASTTKLRIVGIELEESALILDPYVDILRGLDVDNLTAVQNALLGDLTLLRKVVQGLISEAEINGTVSIAVDGALPDNPITMAFEYTLDDGATWNTLEWWDNTAQAYAGSVDVELPDFENGTREQEMDFDISIPYDIYDDLLSYIGTVTTTDLETATHLNVRLKLSSSGVDDSTFELSMPLYIVPISLSDLATLQTNLGSALTTLQTLRNSITDPLLPFSSVSPSFRNGTLATRADETRDRISEYSWSRWSGKKKHFKVGARYEHKFAIYNGNPRSGYYGAYAKMAFEVPMYIFNEKINIVDAYLRTSAYAERADGDELGNTGYQYYLDLFADTLFTGEQWAGSVTFSESPESPKTIRKMLAESWFWVGPIPFSVEAGVKGEIDFSVSLNVDIDNGVTATTEFPDLSLKAYIEGGPDVWVVASGIGADLGLLNNTLTSSVNFDFTYDSDQNRMTGATYDVNVVNDLKAIWGEFYLYYRYKKWTLERGWHTSTRKRTMHGTDPYRNWTVTLYSKPEPVFTYRE